jgi:hypothetical protein
MKCFEKEVQTVSLTISRASSRTAFANRGATVDDTPSNVGQYAGCSEGVNMIAKLAFEDGGELTHGRGS